MYCCALYQLKEVKLNLRVPTRINLEKHEWEKPDVQGVYTPSGYNMYHSCEFLKINRLYFFEQLWVCRNTRQKVQGSHATSHPSFQYY